MADKKLNEVTTKTDVGYILGTLSDGSTVRISKEDLAKVVGGLPAKIYNGDLNLIYETGLYNISNLGGVTENNAPNDTGHGDVLLCFRWNTDTIWQLAFSLKAKALYYRVGSEGTGWKAWKKVATE